jgi:hypothetical protein
MHKDSSQIARMLSALKDAQRLGLLRGVFILPGRDACAAAVEQFSAIYTGETVPSLPLAQCTCDRCECNYLPIGSGESDRSDLPGKSSSGSSG